MAKKSNGGLEKLITSLDKLRNSATENEELKLTLDEVNRALERKVYEFYTLFDIGKEIGSTLNIDEILRIILFTTMAHLKVTSVTIFLVDNFFSTERESKNIVNIMSQGVLDIKKESIAIPTDRGLVKLLTKFKNIITFDELINKGISEQEKNILENLKCTVCIPLLIKDTFRGLLILGSKRGTDKELTREQTEFLQTIISFATLALENARLFTLAITDGLTKLYSHQYFMLRIDEEYKRSLRYSRDFSLLMIDIDHFKKINDTYGHLAGNAVLVQLSKIFQEGIRTSDLVARYGGEEFVILLPEISLEGAYILAERLRIKVEANKFDFNETKISVTISIGLSSFEPKKDKDKSVEEVIMEADKLLYQAKEEGRNCVRCFQIAGTETRGQEVKNG